MNWRSPRLGLAFLLSFSGCSCEWHAGTSSSFGSSGGEQVIVFQDPEGDAQARAEREQRERERAAEQARQPRRAGDASKSIHVSGTPPGAGPATIAGGSVPPAAAPAPAPASIGVATPPPTSPTSAPGPSDAAPTDLAPVAQPTPAPVAEPTPAPAPAPTPAPADTYVPARQPGTRPPNSGGAVTAGDPAQDQKKAPTQPVAPPRSR
jgi:hypothetical protein